MKIRALLLLLLPATAQASSPAAWSAHERAARLACARASGLVAPVTSPLVLFSDTTAQTAMLVTGRWPQRHMRAQQGTMLCLYDRRTKRAETGEAAGWRAPR